ncbi:thialysine N-epsilon-acetyltransferase-like [Ambystoma mexicanum]|uniref:thialysine N-epsilon-acetyltransferase-like n=1 Tax=Ambystoma mexicanum TaxID=8296 RepID=UPI0037E7C567
MECRVRLAVKEDCKDILRMIRELAEYEKASGHIKITEEMLREDGFTDNPFYKCLVAELPPGQKSKEGFSIVGHALFVFSYSSWKGRIVYLEDIYVMPEFRGYGIGKKFMRRVARIGMESKCSAIQLAVLNWNDTAIDFYFRHGATDLTNDTGYLVFRFEEEATRQLAQDDDGN